MRAQGILCCFGLVLTSCGGWEDLALEEVPMVRSDRVIDGAPSPDFLGFAINAAEQGAVLGQLVTLMGKAYQGCSATLVGDRVVVTASHCVVMNQNDWLYHGADPEVADPADAAYASGTDVNDPDCLFQAESVQIHPDAGVNFTTGRIDHDLALIVLDVPASESCPDVVPLQMNRAPLTEALIGEHVLQGGFGSVDGSYDFSPIRYWSVVEVNLVTDDAVQVRDTGLGFPTFGDSGAGVLQRISDGSLKNLGVCSSGASPSMQFVRTDHQASFIDATIDQSMVCGSTGPDWVCREDGIAVRCDAQGFSNVDCRNGPESECAIENGEPTCLCHCDQEAYCEADCSCDPECPCQCDASFKCDPDCPCDPECYQSKKDGCATVPATSASALLILLGLVVRRRR